MKRTTLLAALAALTTTAATAGGRDEGRPDLSRVERMAESAAERFGGCCRGQAFDRAARRAWLREQQQRTGSDKDRPPKRLKLRELPKFKPARSTDRR